MPHTYRVAVIGHTGRGNYGHGLDIVWREFANVQLVAVADADEQGKVAAQKRLGAERAYADYREMLKRERPHIVAVAPRFVDEHRDMVLACAEAGASVFLDKPLCRTLLEADEMVAACEKHHVKLAIAHQTSVSPRVKRIQEMIGSPTFGELLQMHSRGKEDHRGGAQDLMIHGTHLFDLMRLFAGDARWCFARLNMLEKGRIRPAQRGDIREGIEGMGPILGDHVFALYGFDNGVVALHGTMPGERGERFGLTLWGSRGVIQLTTGSLPAAYFLPDPSWFPGRSKAGWQEITSAGLGKPEPLKDGGLGLGNVWIVRDLMDAIEKDRQPKCNIYQARAALEMILAAYESYRLQTPVNLPLRERRHPLGRFSG